MNEVERLKRQLLNQRNRITSIEDRYKDVSDDINDLVESVTKFVSAYHSKLYDDFKDAMEFGEKVLERMRKKYG